MQMTFRPIERWAGEFTAHRRRSPFKATYTDTLRLLDRELRQLAAHTIVLQIALPASKIRLDGLPYSDARPDHPGIILSFESKHGALSYPCDTFDRWEDNLRAIALGLEHLRAVDRYGVTKRGEQYTGWQCLTGPSAKMTREEAFNLLAEYRTPNDTLEDRYRAAAKALHPDRNGGDEVPFKRLQEAKAILGL